MRIVPFRFAGSRFVALVEDLRSAATTSSTVTPAEREIAQFVASGLSNAQIAATRGTSTCTVANQVASLMRKLGVASRLEIALACGKVGGSKPASVS